MASDQDNQASVPLPAFEAPFLRAPEGLRTICLVTLAAACAPLLAGTMLFGWRSLVAAALCVGSCAAIEHLYYRVTRAPALHGRSHACLTGLLLALTLPAYAPWYVPVVASGFAIIVGKAVFGGVGHFLWQPALVGRLAVAVIFSQALGAPFAAQPGLLPVLAQDKMVIGDIRLAARVDDYRQWRSTHAPGGADALLVVPPQTILSGLMNPSDPSFSALACIPEDLPRARPAALTELPPINDLLYGARPGGIGETCPVAILLAGLYLIYRSYVKGHLPLAFVLAAAAVLAVAPVRLAGPQGAVHTVWWPIAAEGLDVGFVYLIYQLLSGELLLAAFFLATEMTSRPMTSGGQLVFGLGCGAVAMLLRLTLDVPVPCYMAVLAMNTLTPALDSLGRFRRRNGPRGHGISV